MSVSTKSSEAMRLQVLQTLGITSYFPRRVLPGAAPSRIAAPQAAQAEPQVNVEPDDSSASAAVAARSKAEAELPAPQPAPVDDTGRKPGREARPAVAAEAMAEPGALYFQLLLLQVDAELAVLCQVPALAPSRLQKSQQHLLGNILRWLGKPVPADAAPRVFKWPLPGVVLTNNRQEAGTSLSRFLEQAAIEQAFCALLLLGEQATECLQDHAVRNPDAESRPWQVHATHSLDEMLALPALKREVWQTLLPLHAALQSSNGQAR